MEREKSQLKSGSLFKLHYKLKLWVYLQFLVNPNIQPELPEDCMHVHHEI